MISNIFAFIFLFIEELDRVRIESCFLSWMEEKHHIVQIMQSSFW